MNVVTVQRKGVKRQYFLTLKDILLIQFINNDKNFDEVLLLRMYTFTFLILTTRGLPSISLFYGSRSIHGTPFSIISFIPYHYIENSPISTKDWMFYWLFIPPQFRVNPSSFLGDEVYHVKSPLTPCIYVEQNNKINNWIK